MSKILRKGEPRQAFFVLFLISHPSWQLVSKAIECAPGFSLKGILARFSLEYSIHNIWDFIKMFFNRELFEQETPSVQDLGAVSIQEIVRETVLKELRKKAS